MVVNLIVINWYFSVNMKMENLYAKDDKKSFNDLNNACLSVDILAV
jgi:hypothetical protein